MKVAVTIEREVDMLNTLIDEHEYIEREFTFYCTINADEILITEVELNGETVDDEHLDKLIDFIGRDRIEDKAIIEYQSS
jgi:hypothetical protein